MCTYILYSSGRFVKYTTSPDKLATLYSCLCVRPEVVYCEVAIQYNLEHTNDSK